MERPDVKRTALATLLIGIGLMAAVDEIIFHQLLGWHHFYDRSTSSIGLLSDGLLHAGELVALVGGFFLFADLRRRHAVASTWAWAGFFLGAGGFQVLDGFVNHKLLRIHQIRYGVELLPYDLAWNLFGLALIVAGLLLAYRATTNEGSLTSSSEPAA